MSSIATCSQNPAHVCRELLGRSPTYWLTKRAFSELRGPGKASVQVSDNRLVDGWQVHATTGQQRQLHLASVRRYTHASPRNCEVAARTQHTDTIILGESVVPKASHAQADTREPKTVPVVSPPCWEAMSQVRPL